MPNTPTDAKTLADALGRQSIADACEVGLTAVSNQVVRGWFPASWFLVMQSLAVEAGVECPPSLFRMKGFPPSVDKPSDVQGAHVERASS